MILVSNAFQLTSPFCLADHAEPETGAGVFASRELGGQDGKAYEVVRVPSSLAITPVTCRQALLDLIGSRDGDHQRHLKAALAAFEQLDTVILYLFFVKKLLLLSNSAGEQLDE